MSLQKIGRLDTTRIRQDGSMRIMQLIQGLNKSYEDSNFIAGDSPVVLDFYTDMGYNAIQGWITCDGPGDVLVSFSRDGTNYGESWTMKQGENTTLMGIDIATLKLEHTGADSAYRVWLI